MERLSAGAPAAPDAAGPDGAAERIRRALQGDGRHELTAALLRRATLDDGTPDRRRATAGELHAIAVTALPDPPQDPRRQLSLILQSADELARRARQGDRACAQALRGTARWLIATDLPEVEGLPSRIAAPAGGGPAAQPPGTALSITEAQLLACVRRHAPAGQKISKVSGLRQLSGGFSKEMFTAAVEHDRGSEEIVIRKAALGRTSHTLGGEFATLCFAWEHGVPVPEPLWLEQTALGAPALATRKVSGRCLGDVWGPIEPVSRQTVISAAAALARLHSADTTALLDTPLPPMVTRAEILAAVEERQSVLDTVAHDPAAPYAALFTLVLAWLRAHAPDDVARPVLVHGDYGLHNLLVDGHEVTAVVDWERAHLGHPAEDLSYLRPSIEAVLPWEDFLNAYRAAGGLDPGNRRLRFYAVWHDVWRGVSSFRLRAKFLADPARISDAVAGLLMSPSFLLRAARTAFDL
ncbi:phosphotransferase family protein [Actinomadura sp. NBRC 104425]|uniref:phosphotransferase family protein n=1 Tax=Actinomadura sp. NBRC 104425 TaxID=3032204 RepID=UPI002555292D|nr:phosphotransferase family protein [Actinomadura sp. NBRC 104425]